MRRAINQTLAVICGGGAAACGLKLFRQPPVGTAIVLMLAAGLLAWLGLWFAQRDAGKK